MIPSCGHGEHYAKGLCRNCYRRVMHADPVNKERDNQKQRKYRHENKARFRGYEKKRYDKDPLRSRKYKLSERARESIRVKSRAKYKQNPEAAKRATEVCRLRNIGWTIELTEEKLLEQKGCCRICNVVLIIKGGGAAKLCRDHDHATGKARGLLCHICNVSLGLYEKYFRAVSRYDIFETYLGRFQ
jgi:hypothetical protein